MIIFSILSFLVGFLVGGIVTVVIWEDMKE